MAVDNVTLDELRRQLTVPDQVRKNPFQILKQITSLLNSSSDASSVQELILLALEQRDCFARYSPVLNSLVREVGLFPYLDPKDLGLADQIAYEFHRPANLEQWDIVFHRPQAQIYRELLSGRSVVLSAPTSFGKSLIVDAVIASGRFKNLLIVVPTIALIDETRRRLARFRESYKIITHPYQGRTGRNIFVLTQERALEMKDLESIDFFVIDEFYKLSPERADDDRCSLLNQVLYRLTKQQKQFYMLGPNVEGVVREVAERLTYTYYKEDYNTVVSRLHTINPGQDEYATLAGLCKTFTDPTIIFCRSPNRASLVAKSLMQSGLGTDEEGVADAADWIGSHYHPEWHFVLSLQRGIGVHHGRIPRALAQYVVRSFNSGEVKFLVCTSTLIEGVNTKAKNIVIFDDTIDKKKLSMFTFNNIKGRSGRMFEHFVGHVYVFHEPPQEGLPFVDMPGITQPPSALYFPRLNSFGLRAPNPDGRSCGFVGIKNRSRRCAWPGSDVARV